MQLYCRIWLTSLIPSATFFWISCCSAYETFSDLILIQKEKEYHRWTDFTRRFLPRIRILEFKGKGGKTRKGGNGLQSFFLRLAFWYVMLLSMPFLLKCVVLALHLYVCASMSLVFRCCLFSSFAFSPLLLSFGYVSSTLMRDLLRKLSPYAQNPYMQDLLQQRNISKLSYLVSLFNPSYFASILRKIRWNEIYVTDENIAPRRRRWTRQAAH